MITPHNGLILFLSSTGIPALPGGPFRLGIPFQACMDTPLLVVHPPGDPRLDLLGPMDTLNLRKNDVGKHEGPLGVPTPAENPFPFRC